MAKVNKGKTPDQINVVNHNIRITTLQRTKTEVETWRNALRAAESVHMPIRTELYRVYNELWLDAHLHAIIQKRIRNVKNKNIVFRSSDKEIREDLNQPFKRLWFIQLIEKVMEAIFWGHSLIELRTKGTEITEIVLVPRHHVRPELGIICVNHPSETTGIDYKNDAQLQNYLVEVDCGLGLMNIAAANTLYKKFGVIDYSNFVEIFGSPIRIFKYDTNYTGAKEESDNIAEKQGNSTAISLPKDSVDFEIHKGADGNSGNLHGNFVQMLKDELTILVLGQTMTTNDGSSRSQAEVHQEEQDEITKEDMMMVEFILNDVIKPKLVNLGYKLDGYFEFDRSRKLPLKDQLEIAKGVAEKVAIDDDYWYETFGIPKPKNPQTAQEPAPTDPKQPADTQKKKNSVNP